MTITEPAARPGSVDGALEQVARFPRLRYMGSKYRLAKPLAQVFAEVDGGTAVDAFSGSGVVSYLLKAQGFRVVSNDFLAFPREIAEAVVVNQGARLGDELIARITGDPLDDRDFIGSTFAGLYFDDADRRFLDSAWSHIDRLEGSERALAISALVLSAARKQPRGVFTFTDSSRYDDGRRDLRLSLREHFRERAAEYNAAVFARGAGHLAQCGDVTELRTVELTGGDPSLVYLDPPYAPPTDDADYMKRYHFLQGLATYWRGQEIMPETKTKKIAKRFTPFAYRRTVEAALERTFEQFSDAGTIVLSYSSNSVPDAETIEALLRRVKPSVTVLPIAHSYSFGTHAAATRRAVSEFIFVAR